MFVSYTEKHEGVRTALHRRPVQPLDRLRVVHRDAPATRVAKTELDLRRGVAAFGRARIPLQCFGIVLRNAGPRRVESCQQALGDCVTLIGRSGEPSSGQCGVALLPPTLLVHHAKIALCCWRPLRCGLAVPLEGLRIVSSDDGAGKIAVTKRRLRGAEILLAGLTIQDQAFVDVFRNQHSFDERVSQQKLRLGRTSGSIGLELRHLVG